MDTRTIERTALSNLIYNEDYARKVLPFIKGNYFEVREERIIFEEIFNGELEPTAAFMTGKLKIDGDMGTAMRLANVFS